MNKQLYKLASVVTIILAAGFSAFAQSDVIWKRNFGGSSLNNYGLITAVPDGIIAAGYSVFNTSEGDGDWAGYTGKGGCDAILVKYDQKGDTVWKKIFGGSNSDGFISVTTVSDGIIAVGDATINTSGGDGDWVGYTGKGKLDAVIVKYDYNGDIVWKKNFGGSSFDRYFSVTEVSDGIIAVGYSLSDSFGNGDWTDHTGKGIGDAIVVKYNHNGDVVWKKNFGGRNHDCYNSVVAVSDGFIAVGYSNISTSGDDGDWTDITGKGLDDAIIVKYNNNGDVVWKKKFGGSSWDYYESITAAPDGSIIAAGYSVINSSGGDGDWTGYNGKGDYDAIIVKYDYNGDIVWKKIFGGSSDDKYYYVTAVSDGIIASGYSVISTSGGDGDWTGYTGKGDFDAIIVKYDYNGNIVWKKHFGGSGEEIYYSVVAVSDGIVAAGYAIINTSGGDGDWSGYSGKGRYDAIIVKHSVTVSNIEFSEERLITSLRVYPNPVNGQLRIKNEELREGSIIKIYDISGKLILTYALLMSEENVIDVSSLASGMYYLKIGNEMVKIIKN